MCATCSRPAGVNIGTTEAAPQAPRGLRGPFRGQEPLDEFFERLFGGPAPQAARPQQSLAPGIIIARGRPLDLKATIREFREDATPS